MNPVSFCRLDVANVSLKAAFTDISTGYNYIRYLASCIYKDFGDFWSAITNEY